MHKLLNTRNSRLCIALATLFLLLLFTWTPRPPLSLDDRADLVNYFTGSISQLSHQILTSGSPKDPGSDYLREGFRGAVPEFLSPASNVALPGRRFAFATFLASEDAQQAVENMGEDKYYVAVRILLYQILHAPETRSRAGYPLIVLVTLSVSAAKRQRLQKDGAVIVEATPLDPGWVMNNDVRRWSSVMMKLRLWELIQYDRIVFLDSDTVMTRTLDDIFDDPAVATEREVGKEASALKSDEAPMPLSYVFASSPEMKHEHHVPASVETDDFPNVNYLNAGFFAFKPDERMLDYYLSLTKTGVDEHGRHRFSPELVEQSLLNYAHRPDGNMPWARVAANWNTHYSTMEDIQGGVATLHEKWWAPEHEAIKPYMESWRWRMHGFFEARDGLDEANQTSHS